MFLNRVVITLGPTASMLHPWDMKPGALLIDNLLLLSWQMGESVLCLTFHSLLSDPGHAYAYIQPGVCQKAHELWGKMLKSQNLKTQSANLSATSSLFKA